MNIIAQLEFELITMLQSTTLAATPWELPPPLPPLQCLVFLFQSIKVFLQRLSRSIGHPVRVEFTKNGSLALLAITVRQGVRLA